MPGLSLKTSHELIQRKESYLLEMPLLFVSKFPNLQAVSHDRPQQMIPLETTSTLMVIRYLVSYGKGVSRENLIKSVERITRSEYTCETNFYLFLLDFEKCWNHSYVLFSIVELNDAD